MVMINRATKEITLKIVYYGPGLCGKTTNLEYIYAKANPQKRGKLLTVATETDRTLFFDFLPMELGTILGMKLRVQLYTVPGQVFYDATRRIVLRGSDGIVFVADSQKVMMDANWESLENMKKNLLLNSLNPDLVPLVMQYNKQDLPNLATVGELEEELNWRKVPYFKAVATVGDGVNETVRKIIELVIRRLHENEANLKHPQRATEVPPSPAAPPPAEAVESPESASEALGAVRVAPAEIGTPAVEDTTEEEVGVEVETEFEVGPTPPAPPEGAPDQDLPELEVSVEPEVEASVEPGEGAQAEAGPELSAEVPEVEVLPDPPASDISAEAEVLPPSAVEVEPEAETLPDTAVELSGEVPVAPEPAPSGEDAEPPAEEPAEAPQLELVPLAAEEEGTGPGEEHARLARDVDTLRRAVDDMLHRLRGFVSEVEDLKARLDEFTEKFGRE